MRAGAALAGLAAGIALTGCGGAGATSSVRARELRGRERVEAPARPATLAPGAVPYLPSSVKALSPGGLARETRTPSLAGELTAWGYTSGAVRYFQGESHRLQVVDSRTLRFRSARGASAFVAFVRGHTDAYLGSFAQVRTFASRGRRGILAVGQPCQCHLANPAFLGVVSRGGTVSWLLINGPAATVGRLAALMSHAP